MITKIVKRYYCEHCKKSGGSSYHMRIHEAHCTLNPNRKCRMCIHTNGSDGFPISELIEIFGDGCNYNFDQLHTHVDGCPACILSAIRQSKFHQKPIPDFNSNYHNFEKTMGFDFKAFSKSFWGDVNDQEVYY